MFYEYFTAVIKVIGNNINYLFYLCNIVTSRSNKFLSLGGGVKFRGKCNIVWQNEKEKQKMSK